MKRCMGHLKKPQWKQWRNHLWTGPAVLSQSLQICRPPFDLHRYFCLQQFSVLYSSYFSYHVQYCDDPSDEKTFVVAKDFTNIALAVFDVSLLGQPLYISLLVKMSTTKWRWLKRPYGFCNRCKCGGILGNSCSSLISGTCGSQLSVLLLWWSQYGVLLIFSLLGVMSFARYFATDWAFCWRFLSSS